MTKRYLLPSTVTPWGWGTALSSSSSPVDSLQRRMSRVFDDMFSGFELGAVSGLGEKLGSFNPRVTLTEDEQRFKVTAELPGLSENDIEISLTKEGLTLRGEKAEEKEAKESTSYYSERTYGSFVRQLPLPAEVDEDKVDASFSKGVLTILLPKAVAAQKQSRKISVRASP